jgi:bifunctional UDP-N-acetylglucosamine pyrophosphorylase / glucosamine-1-phosphate N-acetyltransferase
MYKCAVILAAGEGKRMKSIIPKVIHKVCGKEMVNHVIDTLRSAEISDINIIVGNGADMVIDKTKSRNVLYSIQEKQKGTGHAVMCADLFLKDKSGIVTIFAGDAPLITPKAVKELLKYHEAGGFKATILTSIVENPFGYGRVVRKSNGEVKKIVEHKDCNDTELEIKEINSGMYCFDIKALRESLKELGNNNSQGEYYLTDVIEIMKKDTSKIGAYAVPFEETMGVNSKSQLADAEKVMRKRINLLHMNNGITIIDPENTYIEANVRIGQDTIIYPGNVLQGNTVIGVNCTLFPNSRIDNSKIGDNVNIQSSVILDSQIGEQTTVGPFAYIRPESVIGKSTRIGDFVEIKKSTIGDNTKVSHLTYIGDAQVGSGCNFGCGTVVVNYDGKIKTKTIIGNNSFIGCNTNLISPVIVNDDTYIAAGSTITREVSRGELAVARAKQINIEGWVFRKGLRKK